MKPYVPVLIIVGLIVLCLILYLIPSVRACMTRHKAFLDFLSIVSILGLVVSLSLTVYQYNRSQDIAKQQRMSELNARLEALQSEIDVNLHVCKAVSFCLSQEKKKTAFERFYFPILERMLGAGDLTEKDVRDTAWEAYQSMHICNRLLTEASELSDLQYDTPVQTMVINQTSINKRISKLWDAMVKSEKRAEDALELLHKDLELMKNRKSNNRMQRTR